MTPSLETFPSESWAVSAAAVIADALQPGSVVLTGGGAAESLYPHLREVAGGWRGVDVFFTDERCVPPDDDRSNSTMAQRTLLEHVDARAIHRIRGEAAPAEAASDYDAVVRTHAPNGFDLMILGLGPDGHIAGLFPGSPALGSPSVAEWIYRTDGLKGITLTPRALMAARRIVLIVTGESKAEAVRRLLKGEEPVSQCPARLLLDHPSLTVLTDPPATSHL